MAMTPANADAGRAKNYGVNLGEKPGLKDDARIDVKFPREQTNGAPEATR